jgi:hypothetical protein
VRDSDSTADACKTWVERPIQDLAR